MFLDEKRKTHDMVLQINGSTDMFREQSNRLKKRSKIIELTHTQQEVISGQISVVEFLLRVTYRYTPGNHDRARDIAV